ncbi:MAG: regulatory iron-sulfur-containing complex subunit RicT, partial [Bacteroidota bacterium]
MGCSCSTGSDGKPKGCRNNGTCGTSGCNKLNTYNWLSDIEAPDFDSFNVVEVSFKKGSRKGFYFNEMKSRVMTGDQVVVEANNGYDIGRITLSGELVRMQMKKKRVPEDAVLQKVMRRANERDLERLHEARQNEQKVLVRSRAIARSLGLEMKVGDIEYQGDRRKITFYYTADGRVDFRELIKHYAREFRVKVEMRQIGARQESARIGGIGSCGRELCCSTWLSDFKSVSTSAARYQNLAINQSKLSGQCGRLKCCLNYELDTYMEALRDFPKNADVIETEAGRAYLIKMDIFKGIMYYTYRESQIAKHYAIPKERIHEILEMKAKGIKPAELKGAGILETNVDEMDVGFESADLTGVIELPPEKRKKKRRNNRNRKGGNPKHRDSRNKPTDNRTAQKDGKPKQVETKPNPNRNKNRRNRPNNKQNHSGGNQQ